MNFGSKMRSFPLFHNNYNTRVWPIPKIHENIKKKSLLQRLFKIPWNTMLKPYTTRMAKIHGPKEGKTYSNIYRMKLKEEKEREVELWVVSHKTLIH